MTTAEIVVLCLVGVLLIAAVVLYLRQRASQNLRSRFGPEYGRAMQEVGAKGKAEAALHAREVRVRKYHIHPLTSEDRQRFDQAWRRIQARFVDNPNDATASADDLLGQVMTAQGYPDGDFDHRLEDLSVDHAQAVQNYRAAHDLVLRHGRGEASTEDMRQAMLNYRTLFDELVGEPQPLRAAS